MSPEMELLIKTNSKIGASFYLQPKKGSGVRVPKLTK